MRKPLPTTAAELYIVLMGERFKNPYHTIVQQELPNDIQAALERLAVGLAHKK